MSISPSELLTREWLSLQNHYEQYEKNALLIKLVAIALYFAAQVLLLKVWVIGFIILILWVEEGIFRTYQTRLGERILRVEHALKNDNPGIAGAQLHSEWLAARPGLVGLLAEYARSAARPTVAFPYLPLLVLVALV